MQPSKAAILCASLGMCAALGAAGYFLAWPSDLGASSSVDAPEGGWFEQADLRMKQLEETVSSLSITVGNLAAQQRLQDSKASDERSSLEAEPSAASERGRRDRDRAEPDWMQALREKLGPNVPLRLDPGGVIDGAPGFYNPTLPKSSLAQRSFPKSTICST